MNESAGASTKKSNLTKSLIDLNSANQLANESNATNMLNKYLTYIQSIYHLDGFQIIKQANNTKSSRKINLISNASNKKSNSLSDSSTADSDSGYMDDDVDKQYSNQTLSLVNSESENEYFDLSSNDKSSKFVFTGYAGRAKNDSDPLIAAVDNVANLNNSLILNYGDDVGFISNKSLNDVVFQSLRSQDENEVNAKGADLLVNKYYFSLADGVSANRLRGYDAKLFPNALINACAQFIDQIEEFYVNYEINYKTNKIKEQNVVRKLNEDKLKFEKVANILRDFSESYYEEYDYGEDDEETEEVEEDDADDNEDEEDESKYSEFYINDEIESENIGIEENDCEHLKSILSKAHNLAQENQVYGSSTVCLLSLEFFHKSDYSLLSSCNIGDSGYMIVRDGKVLFKSQSQSHRYNAPFQLGCTPPELAEHNLYRDKADDAICHSHLIKSGDFILISSDGCFDNLYEDEIALIINQYTNNSVSNDLLDTICNDIVQKASKAGIKRDDMLVMLIYID